MCLQWSFKIITGHTIWDDPNQILAEFINRLSERLGMRVLRVRLYYEDPPSTNVLLFCLCHPIENGVKQKIIPRYNSSNAMPMQNMLLKTLEPFMAGEKKTARKAHSSK